MVVNGRFRHLRIRWRHVRHFSGITWFLLLCFDKCQATIVFAAIGRTVIPVKEAVAKATARTFVIPACLWREASLFISRSAVILVRPTIALIGNVTCAYCNGAGTDVHVAPLIFLAYLAKVNYHQQQFHV